MAMHQLHDHEADFVKNEKLWCEHCDGVQVDSNDPATGKFLSQFGHIWNPEYKTLGEGYTLVIYALCMDCLTGKTVMMEVEDSVI